MLFLIVNEERLLHPSNKPIGIVDVLPVDNILFLILIDDDGDDENIVIEDCSDINFGILTDLRFVHPLNTKEDIVTVFSILNDSNIVHPSNALFPIDDARGTEIVLNRLHPLKEYRDIITDDKISREDILVFWNAYSSMRDIVVPRPMFIRVIGIDENAFGPIRLMFIMLAMFTVVIDCAPPKHADVISLNESGTLYVKSDVHPTNADEERYFRFEFDSNLISDNDLHPENAPSPIFVQFAGMLIVFNLIQLLNIDEPRFLSAQNLPKDIVVKLTQSANIESAPRSALA